MRPEVVALRQEVQHFLSEWVLPALQPGSRVLEAGPMQPEWTPVSDCYVNMRSEVTARGCEYQSCDPDPAASADYQCSLLDLWGAGTFDAIIACEVLEHIGEVWKVPGAAARLLKPGGMLFVTVPYYFYRHNPFPDYWRLSEDALRLLFVPQFEVEIEPVLFTENGAVDDRKPLQYWMVGRRRG